MRNSENRTNIARNLTSTKLMSYQMWLELRDAYDACVDNLQVNCDLCLVLVLHLGTRQTSVVTDYIIA